MQRQKERLHAAARSSAARVQVRTDGPDLSCSYIGVLQEDEECYAPDTRVYNRSDIGFEWRAHSDSVEEALVVRTRFDHAVTRGVKPPVGWERAASIDLPDLTEKSDAKLLAANDLTEVHCKVLGILKTAPASTRQPFAVGATVTLEHRSGARLAYILAAHIRDDKWFAHRGSFTEHMMLDDNIPFRKEDLVVVDVLRDAIEEPPRKVRAPVHVREVTLRETAVGRAENWSLCVAHAHFRAEELTAHELGRDADDGAVAAQCFDASPWHWGASEKVWVLCRWTSRSGVRSSVLYETRIDHMLARGIPGPAEMQVDDIMLFETLRGIADLEQSRTKVPCKYLGWDSGASFAQHPKDWPADGDRKSHRNIVFEWTGVVQCANQRPLRTSVRANNLINTERCIGANPLGRDAPSNLAFSIEFAQAVADNVKPGTKFKGISFESERPEIIEQLPFGGRDIQDEQLLWVLPDGSHTWLSLRELASSNPEELCSKDTEDAYRSIGEEMGWDVLGAPICENDLFALRDDPGSLSEERWQRLQWQKPEDEASPCWFLVNAAEEDKTKVPLFCSRSVACLRLEINSHRMATTAKVRHEFDKRQVQNWLAL